MRCFMLVGLLISAISTAESASLPPLVQTRGFAPDSWPELERIARQVPVFAGFTQTGPAEEPQLKLALTDVRQEKKLRELLAADPHWREWAAQLSPGSVRHRYPMMELLRAARLIQKASPTTDVWIDTAMNRVGVDSSGMAVAHQLCLPSILVRPADDDELTDRKNARYDVQPRFVKQSELGLDAFKMVPGMRVRVTNALTRPLLFGYGCGGNLPVVVKDREGKFARYVKSQSDNEPLLACTTELRTRVIAPGETVEFPSFSWIDLSRLAPGNYFWSPEGTDELIPFSLQP